MVNNTDSQIEYIIQMRSELGSTISTDGTRKMCLVILCFIFPDFYGNYCGATTSHLRDSLGLS